STGRFLRTVGRKGSGPNEFQDVTWVGQCAHDGFSVWDWRLERMTTVSSTGEIVRQDKFPAEFVTVPTMPVTCNRNGTFTTVTKYRQVNRTEESVTGVLSMVVRASVIFSDEHGKTQIILEDIPLGETRPLGRQTTLGLSATTLFVGTKDSAA